MPAIKVIWLDGEEEYLMQGNRLVIFSARSHAESQRDFMLEGMQSAVQSVNVVLAPAPDPDLLQGLVAAEPRKPNYRKGK